MRKVFIKIKNIMREDKDYKALIDLNYFSDTLIISRDVLKKLSEGKKNLLQLNFGYSELDDRGIHEIPYSTYLNYVIKDLISRGLINKCDEGYFELTNKGVEIYNNYTFDSLAATAYSNRLAYSLNKKAMRISVIALIVSILSLVLTYLSLKLM